MPSRLIKSRPEQKIRNPKPDSSRDRDFPIHLDQDQDQDRERSSAFFSSRPPADSAQTTPTKPKLAGFLHGRKTSRSTLSPASQDTVNSMPTSTSKANRVRSKPPSSSTAQIPSRMASTIRPVRSFDEGDAVVSEDSSSESNPSQSASRSSAFSSSNSNASGLSAMSQQQMPYYGGVNGEDQSLGVRLKQQGSDGSAPTLLEVPISPGQRRSGELTRSSFDIPQRESSRMAVTAVGNSTISRPHPLSAAAQASDTSPLDGAESQLSNGWDSTIGKAGLGKTGRVINKLVSDNEALKRDIQIERLRADEAKSTARLLEDKMDRMSSDYEGRLLEANVTKTLLARKERQVESLQAAVELERAKASSAADRERMWKDEMEKVRGEAKSKVDEASNHAAMIEGRYNAISSHWKEQGDEVSKAMGKMKTEITNLLEERRKDDEKISTLRDLCDQQDGNIRNLKRQKDELAAQFEKYKAEQEEALREIKLKAGRREEEQERMILESREVLDKLRWALNVKENVKWAQ